ncbi:MAG: thioredoxin family protein [Dehalococcoidia bacterium]|nr:thioredoxin family protein [Dehalococcoidia bacterium]
MAQKTSVVTSGRFTKGLTYKDYLAQVKVNKDKFDLYYGTTKLSAEDKAFFKKAAQAKGGPAKVLVLGEDWCPDVFRGLPVIARIAEAAGMELRVFPRDQNLDIMNEFLNEGKHQSIPTVVFYTKDHKYLTHWIERPARATKELNAVVEKVKKETKDEPEFRKVIMDKLLPLYPKFQEYTVADLKETFKTYAK